MNIAKFCVLASILFLMNGIQCEELIVPCYGIVLTNQTSILITSDNYFDCIVLNQNDNVVSTSTMVLRCNICFPEGKKIIIKGSFECGPDEDFVIYTEDKNTECIIGQILAFGLIVSPILLPIILCIMCFILVILDINSDKKISCYPMNSNYR